MHLVTDKHAGPGRKSVDWDKLFYKEIIVHFDFFFFRADLSSADKCDLID